MISILRTELSENKPVFIALLSIYGLGKTNSILICRKLGFHPNFKIKDMTYKQIVHLIHSVEDLSTKLALASELQKFNKQRQKHLISINSYRGIRLKRGLPVRGQRTHSNAKTAGRFVNKYQNQQAKKSKRKIIKKSKRKIIKKGRR